MSDTRRRLVAGIEQGLVKAGQEAGITGDTREAIIEGAVADIAYGMIRAGRGPDVIALYAAMASREAGDGGSAGGSPLAAALGRLPGMLDGTGSAPDTGRGLVLADESGACASLVTDCKDVTASEPGPLLPVGPSLPLLPTEPASGRGRGRAG